MFNEQNALVKILYFQILFTIYRARQGYPEDHSLFLIEHDTPKIGKNRLNNVVYSFLTCDVAV